MNRLQKTRPTGAFLGRVASVAAFGAVLGLFWLGLEDLSGVTAKQEAEGLANNIRQSAVHCYALEGFYPDSLAYLEEHYGLRYDHDKYVVDYEVIGDNLMPGVTVIRLQGGGA